MENIPERLLIFILTKEAFSAVKLSRISSPGNPASAGWNN